MPRYHVEILDLYFCEAVVEADDEYKAWVKACELIDDNTVEPYYVDEHSHNVTEVEEHDYKWELTVRSEDEH